MARTNTAETIATLAEQVAALTALVATLAERQPIASTPAAPSEAAAHWAARDITCPRGCGRSDFRTANGAKGAHRDPKGATCK